MARPLWASRQFGIDPAVLDTLARDIAELVELGVEVGLVLGGGNLFRGKALSKAGLGSCDWRSYGHVSYSNECFSHA